MTYTTEEIVGMQKVLKRLLEHAQHRRPEAIMSVLTYSQVIAQLTPSDAVVLEAIEDLADA